HPCRDESHDEERDAEPEEYRAERPAGLGNDRFGEDAEAVVASTPGCNLRDTKGIDSNHHGVCPSHSVCQFLHVPRPHCAFPLSPSSSRGRIAQRERAISAATDWNDSPQPRRDMPPERSSTQPTSNGPTKPPA